VEYQQNLLKKNKAFQRISTKDMNQFNRAEIIDNNFLESLKSNSFPKNEQPSTINDLKIKANEIVSIFESQVFSRHIDIKARELKDKGQCFYTIGSSGHESNAVFGNVFPFSDIAFLHYLSGPFLLSVQNSFLGVRRFMIWHYHLWHPQKTQSVAVDIKFLEVNH
jgi:hypothetical protein